jgi:hypothetical protein
MIPESELARALARWKARKLGLAVPPAETGSDPGNDVPVPVFEETTRVASDQYQSEMQTPPAEVHLGDQDYEAYEDSSKSRLR